MKQSRTMSLVESLTNVAIGYGIAVITQILVFPLFGLSTTLAENMAMGAIFTVVSIARSFTLRRVFEAIRMRRANEATAAPKGRRP
ncbi:DUF7220 family protein [Brucella intermedia]|uniref:DUF7220 family protein n=1 Tax=Brucella intermedia TaxID=94625 RepID=UPI002446FFAB|nr:hypothetical protein [Brucella intermedia]WGG59332.1 hypothetical protein QA414_13645 [Brucella intermedia]